MKVWFLWFQICNPSECWYVQDPLYALPFTIAEVCESTGAKRVEHSGMYFGFTCLEDKITTNAH